MSSDDIVTRLREQHASFRVAVGVNQNIVLHALYTEAADEIERLRAENDGLRICIYALIKKLEKDTVRDE